MTTALWQTVTTPDGPLVIVAAEDGAVLGSGWTDEVERVVARIHPKFRPGTLRLDELDAAAAATAYYAGDVAAIDGVRVRQYGTEMQLRGWNALRRVTPGSPLTYSGFAAALGSPSAVRAAASICARNAPALFVPCHRVLRTGGGLGGFAWGLEVKRSLLDREARDH
jgi:methylated-DNA-[protein]-cysteine S-methyltransferase